MNYEEKVYKQAAARVFAATFKTLQCRAKAAGVPVLSADGLPLVTMWDDATNTIRVVPVKE